MKPWVAITAYTPSYKRFADRLIAGCEKHNIPLVCYPYEDLWAWSKNTAYTVNKTLQALNDDLGNIVWLDSDAIVQGPLPFFDTCDCDIAAQSMFNPSPQVNKWCWNTGTIYWANNERVKAFLELEIELLQLYDLNHYDHWPTLHHMIETMEHDLKVLKLPDEYSVIIKRNGEHNPECDSPLVLHTQASRIMRRTYGD